MDNVPIELTIGATPWECSVKVNGEMLLVSRIQITVDANTGQTQITLETGGFAVQPFTVEGILQIPPKQAAQLADQRRALRERIAARGL